MSHTLAEQLVGGARAPLTRAALTLLLQLFGLFDRVDVVDRWYILRGPGDGVLLVDWHQVADDADREAVPMSPGERAVLLLAASLAVGYRVDLASVLPLLDEGHGANLVTAVYSVLRGRDPVNGWTGHERFAGQEERDQVDELPRPRRPWECAYPGDPEHNHAGCADVLAERFPVCSGCSTGELHCRIRAAAGRVLPDPCAHGYGVHDSCPGCDFDAEQRERAGRE